MDITLQKTQVGFIPVDKKSSEWADKIKLGAVVHGPFKRMRNYGFHKKFFALLNLAFEYWEPGEIDSKFGTPEKNFDRFREDLTILAGYFHLVIRLDGTVRPEADSISFAKMNQEKFEKLYSSVIDVLIKQVFSKVKGFSRLSREEIENLADQFSKFGD